jgi:hypothetical protein
MIDLIILLVLFVVLLITLNVATEDNEGSLIKKLFKKKKK